MVLQELPIVRVGYETWRPAKVLVFRSIETTRISSCHCLECQRRTGAVISNQARFRREQVTFAGEARAWRRTAGPHDCNSASELLRVNDTKATVHMKSPSQNRVLTGACSPPELKTHQTHC